jgi:glycosyltransferase involved in cell wall biosynthesis
LPLVEAAAVGTPVITTRVGVAPELLSGPVQKFLVDGDAPDACADALAPAARMREGIGADLARVVRERFSRRTMVDALLAVLASWGGSSKR